MIKFNKHHDPRYWEDYKGQKLYRGDVVYADVYFNGKCKVCDIISYYKNGLWNAEQGTYNVHIHKDMIQKIYADSNYYARRKHETKTKEYWENVI